MDAHELDRMIDRMESYLPAETPVFGNPQRSDWSAFWSQVKVVQAGFKSGVRYATGEQRQVAWERFSALCKIAKARGEEEHSSLVRHSKDHKDEIMSICSGIKYVPFHDVVFFFDKTKVDEMKAWGRYLGKAMNTLRDKKHFMITQHKQECHERINEIKESHELFWAQHKKCLEKRQEEWEAKQRFYAAKKGDFRDKVEGNISNNKEKLRKAISALEKVKEHASEVREKLANSTTAKWVGICSGWLAEDLSRIADIEQSIERIMGWIEEDKRKLRDMD